MVDGFVPGAEQLRLGAAADGRFIPNWLARGFECMRRDTRPGSLLACK